MSTSLKFRLLLALLCASLLVTAVIIQKTYTPKINLEQTAGILEESLHKKEAYINDVIQHKEQFDQLKQLATNDTLALNTIKDFTTDNRIWLFTFQNNRMNFWSGVKIMPASCTLYKEGYSFIHEKNGHYEVIKKTSGNFCALFFIPVKPTYPYQNRYLKNTFDRDILSDDNIEIADFTDKNVRAIHTVDKSYLFSVKLKPGSYNHRFVLTEILFWMLGMLALCSLVNNLCNLLARTGQLFWALLVLALFIATLRFLNLYWGWPTIPAHYELFSPKLYATNAVFPSLGDFCINIFMLCWFTGFIYHHRYKILKKVPGKRVSYVVMLLGLIVLFGSATYLLSLFNGLIINSKINFDVTNVFNLSRFSMIGVGVLCIAFLLFYLLNDAILVNVKRLPLPDWHKAAIFFVAVAAMTLYTALIGDFSFFYLLAACFISIRAAAVLYGNGKFNSAAFVGLVVVCSLISATELNHFQSAKERDVRHALIDKLAASNDVTAEFRLKKVEKDIVHDRSIINYINDSTRDDDGLKTHFQKIYFDGYLSKYSFTVYVFNAKGEAISRDRKYTLNDFKDLVVYSSLKVSEYFYRENENFGFRNYFAILPINDSNSEITGTVIIALRSKPFVFVSNFPELLIDGEDKPGGDFEDYSFAFYSDNKLVNQSGKYIYSLKNNEFKGNLKDYRFTTTDNNNDLPWYKSFVTYNHLIYQPTPRDLIVLSKSQDLLEQSITSLTFFFVIIMGFGALLLLAIWGWQRIRVFKIKNDEITWGFRINFDKVLYKSRIQFSVIFTVVITLLMVGLITFRSISDQYRVQQDNMIHDKLIRIAAVFESNLNKGSYVPELGNQVKFNEFADTYATDLTFYNTNGIALLTTQPKIYNYKLIAPRLNGKVYIKLKRLQKSEVLNEEVIGESNYKAAYVPIRNNEKVTIGYLQLPYFANEADYNDRIGALLNAMINIYAVVFIAIGLFAIIIARQITTPLSFIQQSLASTMYGRKNEPIRWERDDEIGSLVKEYNKMIAALEQSATRLAQSERESAWREMAKQVAHEIKNPLTPLKLGLQLLDKSWKDKDPKFDQKFERFSKSFVEQIESLSSIASEFSAFAKMPDTRLEHINIFEMIGQAVTIFKQMDNVTISYHPGRDFFINADRDQLLRCFNNLLKNAIEAIPQGQPGIIEISHTMTPQSILIKLSDNGNGIPDNLREKIFEPNFTTKSSGTGLGLAFVKNSIENAGGKVWFETKMGAGTTFYLSLPVAQMG